MLLDTSGLFALMNRAEPQHQAAVDAYYEARVRLTHCYVLAELVPLASVRGLPRDLALAFSQRVVANSKVEVLWVGERLHLSALDLLSARRAKSYSLCDAVSFVLMRERGILD